MKTIRGIGSQGSGLYGRKIDTTYLSKLQSVKAGTLDIGMAEADFKKTDQGNFGSGFLKHYVATFDWKNKKVWLEKNGGGKDEHASFGFSPEMKDGKMFVSYVYENSPASENGLMLNDQIISVNGADYNTVSEETYCEMVRNLFLWKNTESINMIIRSGEKERRVKLVARDLLNN